MAIVLASGDASVNHLAVVLEVNCKDRKTSVVAADLTDSVIHILTLFRIEQETCRCLVADRHIMEVPGHVNTLVDEHLKELIGGDDLVVDGGVADGGQDRAVVLTKDIHCVHDLIEASVTAAAVVCLGKSLDGDGRNKVADTDHIFCELLINQCAVREDHEIGGVVLLTEPEDICLAGGRFSAGHNPCVNAQVLALRDDRIKLLVGQRFGVAVLCSPAARAVHVACGSGIHQDNPRNAHAIFLGILLYFLESAEAGLETEVQKLHAEDVRVDVVQNLVGVLHVLGIRILEYSTNTVICFGSPSVAVELLDKIDQLDHVLRTIFVDVLDCRIEYNTQCFTLSGMRNRSSHYCFSSSHSIWRQLQKSSTAAVPCGGRKKGMQRYTPPQSSSYDSKLYHPAGSRSMDKKC